MVAVDATAPRYISPGRTVFASTLPETTAPRYTSPGRTVFASTLPEARRSPARTRRGSRHENDSVPRLERRIGARRMRRLCNDHFVDSVVDMHPVEVRGGRPSLSCIVITSRIYSAYIYFSFLSSACAGRRCLLAVDAVALLPGGHNVLKNGMARRCRRGDGQRDAAPPSSSHRHSSKAAQWPRSSNARSAQQG